MMTATQRKIYEGQLEAMTYPEVHDAYRRALANGNQDRIAAAQDELALRLDRLHRNPSQDSRRD